MTQNLTSSPSRNPHLRLRLKPQVQTEHLETLKEILGVKPEFFPPGYKRFPLTSGSRCLQELGAFLTLPLTLFGAGMVLVSGENLKYISGTIFLDFQPSLKKILRLLFRRHSLFLITHKALCRNHRSILLSDIAVDPSVTIGGIIGQNTVLVMFALTHRQRIVIHVPTSDDGEEVVRRHFEGLKRARNELDDMPVCQLIPIPLTCRHFGNRRYLTQTRMSGVMTDIANADSHLFESRIDSAIHESIGFIRKDSKKKLIADQDFINTAISRITDFVPDRYAQHIGQGVSLVQNWAERSRLPVATVHGDYWIGNILYKENTSEICGIVDWEWCRSDGLPLVDTLQLIVMSHARRRKVEFSSLLCQIWLPAERDEWLEQYLGRISQVASISRRDIEYIAIVLWLETIWRGYVVTQPEHEDWLNTMVLQPCDAIRKWSQEFS